MAHDNSNDSLSDEAKAKLKGCETPEEVMALAKEEGYELSDEELEGISGGWGKPCPNRDWGCDADGYNPGE